MARPPLDISADAVYKAAMYGMKNKWIADMFACSVSTIEKRFSVELAKGRADRKHKLLEWQWQAAQSGNVAMLIWLGKNYLEQTERTHVALTTEVIEEPKYHVIGRRIIEAPRKAHLAKVAAGAN